MKRFVLVRGLFSCNVWQGITLKESILEFGYLTAEEFDKYVDPSKMIGASCFLLRSELLIVRSFQICSEVTFVVQVNRFEYPAFSNHQYITITQHELLPEFGKRHILLVVFLHNFRNRQFEVLLEK